MTSLISSNVSEMIRNNTFTRQRPCVCVCMCWRLFVWFSAGFPTVSRNRDTYQSIDQQNESSGPANPFNQAQDSKPGVRTYWEKRAAFFPLIFTAARQHWVPVFTGDFALIRSDAAMEVNRLITLNHELKLLSSFYFLQRWWWFLAQLTHLQDKYRGNGVTTSTFC